MSLGSVGTLTIELAANVARLQAEMNSVRGQVGGAMNEISRAVNVAKAAFAALGVSLSVGAFVSLIKNSIEATASLHDLSIQTGASVEALSKFRDIGALSGTSAEQVSSAMARMAKGLAVANEESKGTAQAIKALGLNFEEFRRMKPDDQMQAVANAMNRFADGSGKTAVAMTLWGKAGAELLPFMADLAASGDAVATVTAEQAAQADTLTDNLALLKVSSQATTREFASAMTPALVEASQAFVDVMNGSGGLRETIRKLAADGSIERWTRSAIVGLTYVMDMLSGVKRVFVSLGEIAGAQLAIWVTFFSSIGSAAKRFFSGDFKGALDEAQTGMRQIGTIAGDLKKTLSDVWSEETIGQKIRARMAEVARLGATAEEVKPQLDMRAEIDGNTESVKKQVKAHEQLLETLKVTSERELEFIEVTAKRIEGTEAALELAETRAEFTKSVFDGLTDAIFRSLEEGKNLWKAFVDGLENTFKALILRPTIDAVMRPIAGALGGVMGTAGKAVAGTMTGGGGGSGMLGTLGNIGAAVGLGTSMLGAGLGYGLAWLGSSATLGGTLAGAGAMLGAGTFGSMMAGIGAIAGALGPIALGIALLVKGFARGPKEIKEVGITGDIVGGDFSGEQYKRWKKSGSWFVGAQRGTDYKPISEELGRALDETAAATLAEVETWAKVLKLPAEKLAQVNYAIKFKLGKDDEETQRNIEAAFAAYRERLATEFADALIPFQRAGESLTDTLQRMVALQVFTDQINAFGGIFSRVAALSVDAKEELLGFAGGLEAFIQKAQGFVQQYYSEGERAAIGAREIEQQLASLGISASLVTREDFRRLVEAQDISTTEGRKTLDALLTLAQSFAPIADYMAKEGGSLAELAAKAPQTALLDSILKEGEKAGEAQERTADGIDKLTTATKNGLALVADKVDRLAQEIDSMAGYIGEVVERSGRGIVDAIEQQN